MFTKFLPGVLLGSWFVFGTQAVSAEPPQPRTGGTDNDPLIQMELPPLADGGAEKLLAALNQLPWASRTAVLPRYPGSIARGRLHARAIAVVALGERQWADVVDLVRRVREAGYVVAAIHLTDFGTLRIHTQFGPLKGETVEVTEGTKTRVVLAPTSLPRQGIEVAFRKAPWLADPLYTGAGTKPDFGLEKPEVRLGFHLRAGQAIELTTLLDALSGVGFPPVSLRVARLAAGVPFGLPIPGDVELVDQEGVKRPSGKVQKSGRPLVLVFFPLKGKYKRGKEEQSYEAQPAHFARLNEVAGKYADRADFVAISSRKDDTFADVRALWKKANMSFPVLHDPEQKLATALCVGTASPPPHVFIVDADGRFRYAGEFADGWVEPDRIKRVYLTEALDRVLAKQFAANEAVFYNSPPCDCSAPACKCPRCGCGGPCRCGCPTGGG
jgi:peroxiredoxin